MLEWLVIGEDVGKKLNAFLTDRLGDRYSARALKRAVEENRCQINGRVQRFASTTLSKRDHVSLNLVNFSEDALRPTIDKTRILYEDHDLFVYDKPSGVSCDPKGIVAMLASCHPNLILIHRLDKETTGVLLFAKNQRTFDRMVAQFKDKKVRKCYLALVDGAPSQKKGSIQNFLVKKSFFHGQTVWGQSSNREGLAAHTDWEVMKQGKNAALIRCFPRTGRTHQIRVHMAEMGHPILGDFQYCKKFKCPDKPVRCMLHAYEIQFEHPSHKEKKVTIRAKIPDDFKEMKDLI